MKIKTESFTRNIFIVLIVLFLSACHNLFNNDDEPDTQFLVDWDLVNGYTPTQVEMGLSTLIQDYPELSFLEDNAKYGFYVYKITYKTTFQGEEKVASGIVTVPTGDEPFPTISYQNGTNTLHENAPSLSHSKNELYILLEFIASTGFVISMPDYLGFGSSDNIPHPYMHKESTVQSVLDMLRAVEELAEIRNFNLNNELYLTGYSQGGWATTQVQKAIENQHSNEFNLVASAPGAGPYDLNFMNEYILEQEEYPMPYFLGYLFNSYMQLDEITTPIDEVFNAPYDSLIPLLYDGTRSGEEINEELTTNMEELLTENFRQNYSTDTTFTSLITTLEANSAGAWNTSTPTHISHGAADDFVPSQVSENLYQGFLDKGVSSNRVELELFPGLDHTEAIIPSGLYSIQWFLELKQ